MNQLRNCVNLIGHVGQEPEYVELPSGQCYVKMSLATNETYTKKNGEKATKTEWHRLIAWRKLAQNINAMVSKGNQLAVTGRLQYNKYEDKDGVTRYSTDVVLSEFMILSSKSESSNRKRGNVVGTAQSVNSGVSENGESFDMPF